MKKKVFTLIIVLITILLFKINVQADCTNEELSSLKIEAQNINYKLELDKLDNEDSIYDYCYDLIINNLSKNFYSDYGSAEQNNELVVEKVFCSPGNQTNINIYTSESTKCPYEEIRKITITVPYYNKYSERDECKGYGKYDICKSNANTSNITEEDFQKQIEEIIKKESTDENSSSEQIENTGTSQKREKKFAIIIILSVVILLIVIVVIYIIRLKNKRKIKIGDIE